MAPRPQKARRERGRASAFNHGAIRAQLPALPPLRSSSISRKKSYCLSSPIPEEGGRGVTSGRLSDGDAANEKHMGWMRAARPSKQKLWGRWEWDEWWGRQGRCAVTAGLPPFNRALVVRSLFPLQSLYRKKKPHTHTQKHKACRTYSYCFFFPLLGWGERKNQTFVTLRCYRGNQNNNNNSL